MNKNVFLLLLLGVLTLFSCNTSDKEKNNGNQSGNIQKDITIEHIDTDGDGYCKKGYETHELCPKNTGFVDCDDNNLNVHPGTKEICDNQTDDDCDGDVDGNCACQTITLYRDSDGDTYGAFSDSLDICDNENPPNGYVDNNTDCDDSNVDIFPGALGNNDCAPILDVTNASELRNALNTATPGTTINIHSGIYYGKFEVNVSGEQGNYITIRGPADQSAIMDGNNNIDNRQGIVTIESRHHIIIENLEIRNATTYRYGVLVGATSKSANGCNNIELRNLHVHNVGEEIIKIQGKNTHDILVENCIVHTNKDWSGIDVQGHWGGTPSYSEKPRRIIIRNNLIYNINRFAGIGNEFSDNIHAYDNIILGSPMGLDIGCGNYNIIHNNLITSYAYFNELIDDDTYTSIDLSRYEKFSASEIDDFFNAKCRDGIALSGNYMSLIFDNEITDCTENGDLILSYDHWIDGTRHNYDHKNDVNYGHRENLFYRNKVHDNKAYYTIREYNKQENGISYNEMFFNNLFYNNSASKDIIFEHSEGLMFFNNTIVNGDNLYLLETSINAQLKNNIFYNSGYTVSTDSSGAVISNNCETTDADVFMNFANNSFRLNDVAGNVCVSKGLELCTILSTRFQPFYDLYSTEYSFYADFTIEFDFYKDFDGNVQSAAWDIGAFVFQN